MKILTHLKLQDCVNKIEYLRSPDEFKVLNLYFYAFKFQPSIFGFPDLRYHSLGYVRDKEQRML